MLDIISQGIEISQDSSPAAEGRQLGLRVAVAKRIIDMGLAAVAERSYTNETIMTETDRTIAQHLQLMAQLGLVVTMPEVGFDIGSYTVQLNPKISVGLHQRTPLASTSKGFREAVNQVGIMKALADYACPPTTAVTFHDPQQPEVEAGFATLVRPAVFGSRPSYIPFPHSSTGRALRPDTVHKPLEAGELVIAAGSNEFVRELLNAIRNTL